MIKIDLITGFLGSGKTTFLKQYAEYLLHQGMRIGILEKDYGAVNVDMMLLQELEGGNCTLEMVAGGCDADCHRRRFKTKLITMGMSGYDRVLVEPSGIFDVDEFFDALYEEPLCRWYEIGNVFAIVNAKMERNLSKQSEFLLASQIADAGRVILSRTQNATVEDMQKTITYMNSVLKTFQCERRFNDDDLFNRPIATNRIARANRVVCKAWSAFTGEDYETFLKCGYVAETYRKDFTEDSLYSSLYFLNGVFGKDQLTEVVHMLFKNEECGNIIRVKGFFKDDNLWYELNATHQEMRVSPIEKGQDIIIVIGEHMNQVCIEEIFGMKANEL